jgi:phospholipid transport system transporter-binding protein
MTSKASFTLNQTTLHLAGDITLRNAMSLYQESLPLVKQNGVTTFDFASLHSSDSAGIALMVAWLRLLAKQNKKAVFLNVPSSLQSMAKAASMDALFR